jgi:hypothetical protein
LTDPGNGLVETFDYQRSIEFGGAVQRLSIRFSSQPLALERVYSVAFTSLSFFCFLKRRWDQKGPRMVLEYERFLQAH